MKRLYSLFICIFFSVCIVSANTPLSLSEIDELIRATYYDKALEELTFYMQSFPEQFDSVQKRIDTILKMRDRYIKLAHELVDVLENESENDEKILQIIERLEKIEKYPTAKQREFISEAKFTAQFNVYRKQLYALLEQGVKFSKEGNYVSSIKTVQQGFKFYQNEKS